MQLPNTRISERVILVVSVSAALFALFMHFGIARTNLPDIAWKTAGQHIRQHYQPGDVIGLLPSWALRGASAVHGLPVLYAPNLHTEDLSRYKRLWVLQAPRLGKWWFRRAHKPIIQRLRKRFWLERTWHFGWQSKTRGKHPKTFGIQDKARGLQQLTVYLFRLPPARPLLYDFLAKQHLRQAEVRLELPASKHRVGRCPASHLGEVTPITQWQEQPGWFRGRGDYFFGRIIQEIDNTPRDCLYAQPQSCKVLKVRYRNVPLKGELLLEHGFTTPAPGKVLPDVPADGPDIQLSVWVENRLVKRLQVSQRQGWRRTWLRMNTYQYPRDLGSVEFHIQTPTRQQRVGYCFRATLRQP